MYYHCFPLHNKESSHISSAPMLPQFSWVMTYQTTETMLLSGTHVAGVPICKYSYTFHCFVSMKYNEENVADSGSCVAH